MGTAYADDIIQKLQEFQRSAHVLLDNVSSGLYTDYSADDFTKERDALEATLADLEQQLKAGLLYALEDSPAPDTPVPNLQESLLKIDTEIKEAHNVHQKLIKNTKTAASRFHAGE
ncbi:uncharacterized protein ACA1_072010 [Acanthamoeba castellanii str. Neff]|uniref:Uncharacterized protein n=1 Tax=Acanthamoeba castellanii (strain ATCC 30010 / Neff) TaxID=1257118 RepID=L8HDK7_ACACF|nr:uncharacterized protein ACA1_072010 [Acanthamoeba castellanii str. Neff]ELR23579.1 hypothetical protein ACA1_072010 [Acanthamoeba castellanii str. Neff]